MNYNIPFALLDRMTNQDIFLLVELASESDVPAMCDLTIDTWTQDRARQTLLRNVAREDVHKMLADVHYDRIGKPYTQYFIIHERATGKLVAWDNIRWPESDEHIKAHVDSNLKKPNVPGMDERMAHVFFDNLAGSSSRHGYNSTKHLHRRGIFVHSNYQRRGLGAWLTNHCNKIADDAGGITYVQARPSSRSMSEKHGFVIVATLEIDLKGNGSYMDQHHVMRRDPCIR